MNTKPDGGPAFPMAVPAGATNYFEGMSLRDWFAGMALQGYVTVAMDYEIQQGASWEDRKTAMAHYCYEFADAMLAEREKGEAPCD